MRQVQADQFWMIYYDTSHNESLLFGMQQVARHFKLDIIGYKFN